MKKDLSHAARIMGKQGGSIRAERGGKEVYSEMGKKSWENGSSDRRLSTQIIRAAGFTMIADLKKERKGMKILCEMCQNPFEIAELKMIRPDFNQPFYFLVRCSDCLRKWRKENKPVKLTAENASRIIEELKKDPKAPRVMILRRAFGMQKAVLDKASES